MKNPSKTLTSNNWIVENLSLLRSCKKIISHLVSSTLLTFSHHYELLFLRRTFSCLTLLAHWCFLKREYSFGKTCWFFFSILFVCALLFVAIIYRWLSSYSSAGHVLQVLIKMSLILSGISNMYNINENYFKFNLMSSLRINTLES